MIDDWIPIENLPPVDEDGYSMVIVELHDGLEFHVGYVFRLGQWLSIHTMEPIDFEPEYWRPAFVDYSKSDRYTALEHARDTVDQLRSIGVDPAPIIGIRPQIVRKGYLE